MGGPLEWGPLEGETLDEGPFDEGPFDGGPLDERPLAEPVGGPPRAPLLGAPNESLGKLEELYVHHLIASPLSLSLFLKAANCLRFVGVQRCSGLSLSAAVYTLQDWGFVRLPQGVLPSPTCRAFACRIKESNKILYDGFVVMKRQI